MPARSPSRSRSRSSFAPLAPWPSLSRSECLAMASEAREGRRAGRVPFIFMAERDLQSLIPSLRASAERRGALDLWQRTGML